MKLSINNYFLYVFRKNLDIFFEMFKITGERSLVLQVKVRMSFITTKSQSLTIKYFSSFFLAYFVVSSHRLLYTKTWEIVIKP